MANHNPKKEHLIPYKKGQSGNPKGRPRVLPELNKLLREVLGEEKDGIAAAQAILMALRAKATKGDVRAAEVLLDRAYGKAKEHIEMTGNSSIQLNIVRGKLNTERTSSGADGSVDAGKTV